MSIIVTNSTNGSAIFDPSHRYRYCLTRSWSSTAPNDHQVTFIMLNPSQANAERDDPTIRACSQFAQRWGYHQLNIVNLFAYRTPHPSNLQQTSDPIGPDNDHYLLQATESANKVILAWGNWGTLFKRDQTIVKLLHPHQHKLHCLMRNNSGQPRHPLYVKRTTQPKPWP